MLKPKYTTYVQNLQDAAKRKSYCFILLLKDLNDLKSGVDKIIVRKQPTNC